MTAASYPNTAREGRFDAQLTLLDQHGYARPFARIRKRDGSEQAFDTNKIAAGILNAGANDFDLESALQIASAVAIYLARIGVSRVPTSEEVHEAVERVLIEMGHARAAFEYVRHRDDRLRRINNAALDATALVRELRAARQLRECSPAGPAASEPPDDARPPESISIPLREIKQLLCAPGMDSANTNRTPAATAYMLGKTLKRAFALKDVFGPELEALIRSGEVKIDDIAEIDKVHALHITAERLKRVGHEGLHYSARSPAESAEALAAQIAAADTLLAYHSHRPALWDSVNVAFAPYLIDVSDQRLHDLAKVLIYESAIRSVMALRPIPGPARFGIATSVPDYLRSATAIGPNGEPLNGTYGSFEQTARRLAGKFSDAMLEIHRDAPAATLPLLTINVPASAIRRPEERELLARLARLPAAGIPVEFHLSVETETLPFGETTESPIEIVVQHAALDLGAIARRTRQSEWFFEDLERIVEVVARAHYQKESFLRQVVALGDGGSWAALHRHPIGRAICGRQNRCSTIALLNAHEATKALMGDRTNGTRARDELIRAVLERMNEWAHQWSTTFAMPIHVDYEHDVSGSESAALTPVERCARLAGLTAGLDIRTCAAVSLNEQDSSAETILDFLVQVSNRTRLDRIRIGPGTSRISNK